VRASHTKALHPWEGMIEGPVPHPTALSLPSFPPGVLTLPTTSSCPVSVPSNFTHFLHLGISRFKPINQDLCLSQSVEHISATILEALGQS